MVTVGDDKLVKVWDAETGILIHALSGHPATIRAVAFDRAGARIASGGVAHYSQELVEKYPPDYKGSRIYTGRDYKVTSGGGSVKVWDVASGREVWTLTGPEEPIFAVAFDPKDRHVLAFD